MLIYILIGIGFYVGLALARQKTFEGKEVRGIILGLALGILLWPIAMAIVYNQEKK